MKVLDLFSGTRSVAREFEKRGWLSFTIELDKQHPNIDWYEDIMNVTADDILQKFGRPDVIWASPPCTTYSVAGISHHRERVGKKLLPKSEFAKQSDELIKHTLKLIEELNPQFWFIENPRGGLRKMDFMEGFPRHTVTYCQYGFTYMKPTDIWTNMVDHQLKPPCKNGDTCHESAPRGARTGIQRLTNSQQKSVIPPLLCEHIAKRCTDELGLARKGDIK